MIFSQFDAKWRHTLDMKDCYFITLRLMIYNWENSTWEEKTDKLVNLYIKIGVPCPSLSHEGECLLSQKIAEW